MTKAWPKPEYRIRAVFRAPLPFVFTWCTDISPMDPHLQRRDFVRKIIEKTAGRVVYEDLEESEAGWSWDRHVVTPEPPDRWRLASVGNHYDIAADYRLSPLRGGGTRLDLSGRLRPKTPEDRLPTKGEFERDVGAMWRLYAAALERDYRRSQGSRPSGAQARRPAIP